MNRDREIYNSIKINQKDVLVHGPYDVDVVFTSWTGLINTHTYIRQTLALSMAVVNLCENKFVMLLLLINSPPFYYRYGVRTP